MPEFTTTYHDRHDYHERLTHYGQIEYKKGRQEIGNWVPDEIRLKDTLDREN